MATTECPVSYVTGESRAILNYWWKWRTLGRPSAMLAELSAREVDGLVCLEQHWTEQRESVNAATS